MKRVQVSLSRQLGFLTVVTSSIVTLFGCGISLQTIAERNAIELQYLRVGMTRDEVFDTMGTKLERSGEYSIPSPYRTESYNADGRRIEVLFYYTSPNYEVERIADDELTPVVLVDGNVDGWGWSYWEHTAEQHSIRIRRE